MFCSFCNEIAYFTLKNGKPCCSQFSNSCPKIRQKNARGLQKAHSDGRMRYDQFDDCRNWNKGKTAYSDIRIKASAPRDKIFTLNSGVNNSTLKRILILNGIRDYRCENCNNIGEWNGETIVLELDHINGNNRDNSIDNLRFLCPNCHSQTPTYRNRYQKFKTKHIPITDEQLLSVISTATETRKTISSVLRNVGLSGSGNYARIYKLMSDNNISLPERERASQKPKKPKKPPIIKSQKIPQPRKTKIDWDKYDLAALYKEHGSFLAMVRFFNGAVSDNAIRKQMRKRNIIWK